MRLIRNCFPAFELISTTVRPRTFLRGFVTAALQNLLGCSFHCLLQVCLCPYVARQTDRVRIRGSDVNQMSSGHKRRFGSSSKVEELSPRKAPVIFGVSSLECCGQ